MNHYIKRNLPYNILVLIMGLLLGIFWGKCIERKSDRLAQEQAILKDTLLTNIETYKSLDKGNSDVAKSNLRAFINMNLQGYEKIREQNPDFGSGDKGLQELLDQAREITSK